MRKQGDLCTGITQNISDLLQNYVASTMLSDSDFVVLLKQANLDSAKLYEVVGISETRLKFVSGSPAGMGLIKCGNIVISFDNRISKENSLYRLFNTNLHVKRKSAQAFFFHIPKKVIQFRNAINFYGISS